MRRKTVTHETSTTIKRRPNKTTTRSEHKTVSRHYGRVTSSMAKLAAGVTLAAYRAYHLMRTAKPKKVHRKKALKA